LTCNFDDLELEQFKVIHGQRSWCELIAQGGFISTSIDPIVVYVTVLEIFDIKAIIPQEQWCKLIILPVWRISTKITGNHISRDSTLVASLGEDRWRIATRFSSFRVTDRHTD